MSFFSKTASSLVNNKGSHLREALKSSGESY
jgi:hypothetical protein